MPTKFYRLLRWLPPVLWMGFIFIGSTDLLAGAHTSRFVIPFLRWLLGADFTLEKAEYIHHLIRKAGHLTEYAVLGVLWWNALGGLKTFADERGSGRFWTAILLASCYAASDEFHQSFIPTRTANVTDVCIDTVGALLGLTGLIALRKVLASRRKRAATLRPDSPAGRRNPGRF